MSCVLCYRICVTHEENSRHSDTLHMRITHKENRRHSNTLHICVTHEENSRHSDTLHICLCDLTRRTPDTVTPYKHAWEDTNIYTRMHMGVQGGGAS